MTFQPSYTDADLAAAVASSRSWRGVLRALGLKATSAGSQRSARRNADRLGLDYSHFTGQRRWTDQQLVEAVRAATCWRDVQGSLGLAVDSNVSTVKAHAVRLGLSTSHFRTTRVHEPRHGLQFQPFESNLRDAGALLAAAWFRLCGHNVSWPLEPCRYDLAVHIGERIERIQVKTCTRRSRNSWLAGIATSGNKSAYDPDDIDFFFVIDGDLAFYLIPIKEVAGRGGISLSAYQAFKVGSAGDALVPSLRVAEETT